MPGRLEVLSPEAASGRALRGLVLTGRLVAIRPIHLPPVSSTTTNSIALLGVPVRTIFTLIASRAAKALATVR